MYALGTSIILKITVGSTVIVSQTNAKPRTCKLSHTSGSIILLRFFSLRVGRKSMLRARIIFFKRKKGMPMEKRGEIKEAILRL